ncbi:ROK family transcriptional regulator [Devosia sp. ZB163]|uniref:ROK family transcriptional regulator n=1 Tax=Devosia sp. ZB163 TaxID=3025938 RepID=UPI00235F8411|nr:ROK family transcriptional regulator [Devosia sp. ZB163]MDC9826231.1 ROK family transcriptional regulator [Devosia sp. ZB163]
MAVKIADPLLMREINKYHVLETIRCYGRISRVEISEQTLLSGTTVSAITAALIEEGLIEAIHTAPTNDSQRGRPRVLLGLVADAAYVAGIKISETQMTATIADFRGETVAVLQLPIRLARQPAEVIVDLIEDALRDCIARSGVDVGRIKGVGIGVHGIVDPRSGRSHAGPVFGEREVPLAQMLEARMGMPVKIDKSAHLVALAESWFGYAQKDRSFAVVTLDRTAGLGLWIEEEIHRGASGLGPAFGHTKVGNEGRPCICGQMDCLNTYLTVPELEAAVAGAGSGEPARNAAAMLTALAEKADAGDRAAARTVAVHAEKLGLGLSHVVNLINPEKIIVAVDTPRYGQLLEPALRESLMANSFPAHWAATKLIFHTLDDQMWARGAAALMLRDIYSAPWTAA